MAAAGGLEEIKTSVKENDRKPYSPSEDKRGQGRKWSELYLVIQTGRDTNNGDKQVQKMARNERLLWRCAEYVPRPHLNEHRPGIPLLDKQPHSTC